MDFFALAADVAMIIGVAVAIKQLHLYLESTRADHDRRKKQATIEFFNDIQEQSIPMYKMIEGHFGNAPVTLTELKKIQKTQVKRGDDPTIDDAIRRYLSLMERLAVGIHTNVYDFNVYSLLNATTTVRMYHKLREWIRNIRLERDSRSLYMEFEKLAKRLEDEKNKEAYTKSDEATVKHV